MKKFYAVTFGQNSPFRNGYVEVSASTEQDAKIVVEECIGKYSMIYEKNSEFPAMYFQYGKLGDTLIGR